MCSSCCCRVGNWDVGSESKILANCFDWYARKTDKSRWLIWTKHALHKKAGKKMSHFLKYWNGMKSRNLSLIFLVKLRHENEINSWDFCIVKWMGFWCNIYCIIGMLIVLNPYYEYFYVHLPHFPLYPAEESFWVMLSTWIIGRLLCDDLKCTENRFAIFLFSLFCTLNKITEKKMRTDHIVFDLWLMIFQLKLT